MSCDIKTNLQTDEVYYLCEELQLRCKNLQLNLHFHINTPLHLLFSFYFLLLGKYLYRGNYTFLQFWQQQLAGN